MMLLAIIAVQPSRLPQPDQHRQMGLLPDVVLGYVMPAHSAKRPSPHLESREGLVAIQRWLRDILKVDGRPPQRERPPALETVTDFPFMPFHAAPRAWPILCEIQCILEFLFCLASRRALVAMRQSNC